MQMAVLHSRMLEKQDFQLLEEATKLDPWGHSVQELIEREENEQLFFLKFWDEGASYGLCTFCVIERPYGKALHMLNAVGVGFIKHRERVVELWTKMARDLGCVALTVSAVRGGSTKVLLDLGFLVEAVNFVKGV